MTRDVAAISTAARCDPEWAVAVLDAVSWQRKTATRELEATIQRWAQLRGIGVVRQALTQSRSGAQSPFESLCRVRLVARGLPEPRLQAAFHDEFGLIGYADMVWDAWRVIAECDGAVKYSSRDDLLREKAREDRLRALGFAVVRITWAQLMDDPGRVAARIKAAASLNLPSR